MYNTVGNFAKKIKLRIPLVVDLNIIVSYVFGPKFVYRRGVYSAPKVPVKSPLSMPIYRHKLKFCGHEMIDSFVFGVDKSIPIIISDEFKAHLDGMFKLESGNEYLWLNKAARETRE